MQIANSEKNKAIEMKYDAFHREKQAKEQSVVDKQKMYYAYKERAIAYQKEEKAHQLEIQAEK